VALQHTYAKSHTHTHMPAVLRHMARIGDFREAFLTPELMHEHGHLDGISNIR